MDLFNEYLLTCLFVVSCLIVVVIAYNVLSFVKRPWTKEKARIVLEDESESRKHFVFIPYDKSEVQLFIVQLLDEKGKIITCDCSHIAVPMTLREYVWVNIETVKFTQLGGKEPKAALITLPCGTQMMAPMKLDENHYSVTVDFEFRAGCLKVANIVKLGVR